jgi:hypothetical protein
MGRRQLDAGCHCQPATRTGPDAAHDASGLGCVQSGIDPSDGTSNRLRRTAGSCSSGHDQEAVSGIHRCIHRFSTNGSRRFNSLQNVHPAETFPLALACGVATSQIIFVSVQGTALDSVLSDNCRMLAMLTLPGRLPIKRLFRIVRLHPQQSSSWATLPWYSVSRQLSAPFNHNDSSLGENGTRLCVSESSPSWSCSPGSRQLPGPCSTSASAASSGSPCDTISSSSFSWSSSSPSCYFWRLSSASS